MLLFCIPWIVMFLGFKNTKITNNHKLLSPINLPLLFYQPLPFLEKNVPSHICWRINRTPISIPFVKWGRYLAIINQNYLFHVFVTTNKSSNNKNI